MNKFAVGDYVKHRENDFLVFRILCELLPADDGDQRSLYQSASVYSDEDRFYNYLEDDLYKVELTEEQEKALIADTPLTEAPKAFKGAAYRINPIFSRRAFKRRPKSCFVLMPFTLKWSRRLYTHITEIMRGLGYKVYRADDLYGTDVLEDIWAALNEAEIVLADVTGKNPNVFYEVGIAHTIGKRVILISQNVKDIPFDFKRYRHILYEDNVEGFELLRDSIPKHVKSEV